MAKRRAPHTYEPFEAVLGQIRGDRIDRWSDIENEFVRVVSLFDSEYRTGSRDSGWYKAKARYFNDAVVALLSNRSGRTIATRKKRESELFGELDVDMCFPDADPPTVAAEVKMLGTPPHPGNDDTARDGSQDMHKRLREVALTAIDFKVANSRPKPIRSFQNWIESTPPWYFSFWGIRVNSDSDFERLRRMLSGLRSYCNGVGAFLYSPEASGSPTNYRVRSLHDLKMDRAIHEMAQRIA